jgi:uncharacterized protein Usg
LRGHALASELKDATVSASPDPSRYRLTTAEIVYRMPDDPDTLQTFIWQKFDLAPDFPELSKFLDFWRKNIDGELHSVKVAQGNGRSRRFPYIVPASAGRH